MTSLMESTTNPPPRDDDDDDDNHNSDDERKHHEEQVVKEKKKKTKTHRHHNDNDGDDDDDKESPSKRHKRHRENDTNDDTDDDDEVAKKKKKREKKRKEKRKKKETKTKKHRKKRARSSSSSSSSSDDDDDDNNNEDDEDDHAERSQRKHHDSTTTTTQRPPQIQHQNHDDSTMERQERRRRARAALLEHKFGYTVDDNPFHDPNLTDTFVWNKKKQKQVVERSTNKGTTNKNKNKNPLLLLDEIDKVRERRQQREEQKMEVERIRAQESRMKEYEQYDQFNQKEEAFHYQQQQLRSAIRLLQQREKPIDVFAKQILLFGGIDDNDNAMTTTTKYQEAYNVLDVTRDTLEMELEEPYLLLKSLTYEELQELLRDILVFSQLERDAATTTDTNHATASLMNHHHSTLLQYWENLAVLTRDEMKYLQPSSSSSSLSRNDTDDHAKMVQEIAKIFVDQSISSLQQMKDEIATKLQQSHHSNRNDDPSQYDYQYWTNVQEQIQVYMAKRELSQWHAQMLTRQLQRLEQRRVELLLSTTTANATTAPNNIDHPNNDPNDNGPESNDRDDATTRPNDGHVGTMIPANVPVEMLEDLEEELGLAQEVAVVSDVPPRQQQRDNNNEQYRSRKPRYYNRVKSGYDWSKYNQTHYDRDNPPPKIVQGYKFNIFYPDLINPLITPQFTLEPVVLNNNGGTNNNHEVSRDYCIIRFRAGPPYEDLAFQIVNREWNRSRKRGYKCTFERGVLSLYFNFTTHWYRK